MGICHQLHQKVSECTVIIPEIIPLSTQILAIVEKIFFIYHTVPGYEVTEWALVCCCIKKIINKNPTTLQDGIFLVELFIFHPNKK